MSLKPEVSLTVGLAVGALVYGVYSNALPTVADIRVSNESDPDIAAAEQLAAWTSAAVVAGVSLIAKDPTVFVIGGSMVIALSWWHRHANEVNPLSGFASKLGGEAAQYMPEQMSEAA
jgi:hypothetical protein